jgi:hypothetical protein
MQYPLDDNTDQYAGKIQFLPIVEKYIDAAKTVTESLSSISNSVENFDEATGLVDFGGIGETVTRKIQAPLTTYGKSGSGAVTLYLPQAITIQDGVQYDTLNLGTIGAVGLQALQSGADIKSAAFATIENAGSSMIDFISNRSGMASQLAGLAAVRLANKGGETTRGVAGSAFGVAVNPNTRALFKSVNLREFSFSFKMIASSAAEANAIEQIVKTFRTELYPEIIEDNNIPLGYYYPNKFKINMTYAGREVATKFLPAHLKSVNVVYNPSSMGWHADGKPSEVDLTLSFGEPRTLSKKDIKAGY